MRSVLDTKPLDGTSGLCANEMAERRSSSQAVIGLSSRNETFIT